MLHGSGVLQVGAGGSAAQRIAWLAPGAHVVKAFHLFPAAHWAEGGAAAGTVAMCGDDTGALETVGRMVRDLGGTPALPRPPAGGGRGLLHRPGLRRVRPSSALPGAHRAA